MVSCKKDTCNSVLGNTYEKITADSVYINAENRPTITFSTLTLAELPENYFSAAVPSDDKTIDQIYSYHLTKNQIKLILDATIVPADSEQIDLIFNLTFEDRRNYIDCDHPGSSDTYFLEIAFTLIHFAPDQFEIINLSWSELFATGHI